MKRSISLLLVLSIVFILSACLGSSPAPTNTPVPQSVEEEADTTDEEPAEVEDAEAQQSDAEEADDEETTSDEEVSEAPAIDAAALYAANGCAGCHGADRQGGGAPSLLPDQLTRPAEDYVTIITDGKGRMPSFSSDLSQEEIEALVDWLLNPVE